MLFFENSSKELGVDLGKKILTGNNLSAHLSTDVLKLCKENDKSSYFPYPEFNTPTFSHWMSVTFPRWKHLKIESNSNDIKHQHKKF